ncbi:MAG: hydroxymethylglutaryl-CoA synthase [Microgenomates group bacterium]|nr:hydroxymethylglutaryl-CoA synthase [Microgenomates group bacterium]
MIGIVSYGFYVPKYRILIDEIASVWGKNSFEIKKSLNVWEKAVATTDEDALTMGYQASYMAINKIKIDKRKIKSVFFGSETFPYAVNPSSTILAEFLGIEKNYLAYDTQFACKAATSAVISTLALIKSGYEEYGLVCGSDKAVAKTHDVLEYTVGSGAVSLLLGKTEVALEILDYDSFSSDTPDFWRREGIRYPSHGGRFTGKPSYFYHISQASKKIFQKNHLSPKDFNQAIFHMPNGKFPLEIASFLGFSQHQVKKSLTVCYLGNCYSASALMGLVAVLEHVKKNDLIFLASYGSGAGSDVFILKATENLEKITVPFQKIVADKKYINYPTYLKFMNII